MDTIKSKARLYEVCLTYNIEEESATKALDKVLGCSPVTPIAFGCEPIMMEEDDD